MWSRKLILAASLIASLTNVATPFVLGQFLGLTYVALWVSYRAMTQLVISLVPNSVNSLLYLSKYSRINRRAIIKRGYFTACAVVVLQSVLLLIVSNFIDEMEPFIGHLILYAAAFQFAGFQNVVVRSLKRSDILIKVSITDMLLTAGLLGAVVIFPSFELFILLSACKELLRGIYTISLRLPGSPLDGTRLVPSLLVNKYKFMHVSRGSIQVLSQMGDRMIYPFIFTLTAAGQAALGSSVGMIVALLSSSAFTWALPKTMEGQDMATWLFSEWARLTMLVVCAAAAMHFLIPTVNTAVAFIMNDPLRLDGMFVAAFVFASISSINFLSFGTDKKRLSSKAYLSLHALMIFLAYFSIFLFHSFGLPADLSIYYGSVLSVIGFLVLNFRAAKSFMNKFSFF